MRYRRFLINTGFTLIEVLIVAVIIALLSYISIPMYHTIRVNTAAQILAGQVKLAISYLPEYMANVDPLATNFCSAKSITITKLVSKYATFSCTNAGSTPPKIILTFSGIGKLSPMKYEWSNNPFAFNTIGGPAEWKVGPGVKRTGLVIDEQGTVS